MDEPASTSDRAARLAKQLDEAIEGVARAKPFAKSLYQGRVYDLTVRLLKEPGGAEAMYAVAPRLDAAGVFYGGDWNFPLLLQPALAGGSLRGQAYYIAIEALSELRMLAIALGDYRHEDVSPAYARNFLEQVLALNIDLLFPRDAEADRATAPGLRRGVEHLFQFIAERLGLEGILSSIVTEVERLLLQRPIMVERVKEMLMRVADGVSLEAEGFPHAHARRLLDALHGPSDLSRRCGEDLMAYHDAIAALDPGSLSEEAARLAAAMRTTGLVSRHHAVLLRHVADLHPELAAKALGLDAVGRDSLDAYSELTHRLIECAVHPETAQCIYGLACLHERGLLFFPPVAPGMWRQISLKVLPEVSSVLQQEFGEAHPGETYLLAGVMSLLGQPLGVGQGRNPTCQSVRALSLWAQHDVPFLLELIAWAARDGEVDMHFEGQHIVSSNLAEGLAANLHTELDPVSLVLVPHLDRVYAEMGRRVAGRGEDGHKWINPELHGWWVSRGFAIAIQLDNGAVRDLEGFVRLFYATYHPYYNGGRPVIHPQPAGIAATNNQGAFVGWHAVTIQRIMLDADNVMRVYFFNPNNDGGQDWGQGIVTSTSGAGEHYGESSLPFEQFAARLYVFHFNPREIGERAGAPDDMVARIIEWARESWALQRTWDPTPREFDTEFQITVERPELE